MTYFVFYNRQEHGPYSIMDLQRLLAEGSFQSADLARTDQMQEWIPLGELLQRVTGSQVTSPLPPVLPPMPSQPVRTPVSPPPSPNIMLSGPVAQDNGNPLTWPFAQPKYVSSLWMTLLWWVPFPIPFGQFLHTGWSMEVIRRKSQRVPDLLPQNNQVGKLLQDGALIFCMYLLYYVIPVVIIGWITAFSASDVIWPTIQWIWDKYAHHAHETQSLLGYLWGQFVALLLRAEWPVIYLAVASPLFMVARIQFAITGKARSFIFLHRNAMLIFKHFGDVLATMFFISLTKFVIGILVVLISATVLVPILLGAAQIWIVAYLLGNLAAKFTSAGEQ